MEKTKKFDTFQKNKNPLYTPGYLKNVENLPKFTKNEILLSLFL